MNFMLTDIFETILQANNAEVKSISCKSHSWSAVRQTHDSFKMTQQQDAASLSGFTATSTLSEPEKQIKGIKMTEVTLWTVNNKDI